jgi:ribosomal protein S17E
MITYGPEYKVDVTCPTCGATNTYTIMLNELDVNYLDDDFKEPIEVTLPRSGHKLSLKILRNEDSDFIDRYSKKFAKQFNLNVREVEFTARLAKYITAIDGEQVDFTTAKDFVDNLMSRDSAEIRSAMNRILVGVDTRTNVICKSCSDEFTFSMPLTSEFFRPTFE